MAFKTSAPDITPDDIDVSDTVTFVWEIKWARFYIYC
jgi:hypothetical protein